MILTNRWIGFFAALLFLSAATVGSEFKFEKDIREMYKDKVVHDYPLANPESIEIDIKELSLLAKLTASASEFKLQFPQGSDVVGRTVLPIRFFDTEGDIVHKGNIVVDVEAMAPYYRTTRLIKRHKVIQESDIELVDLSVKGQHKNVVRRKDDIVGRMTASTLAAGSIMTAYMLKEVPVVKIGSNVIVLLQNDGFELRVKGRALDDGSIGDTIRVQTNLETRKIIYAEVLNETTVRYHFFD